MSKPGEFCEECKGALRVGDDIYYTDDMYRFWHVKCLDEACIPIAEWPKQSALRQNAKRGKG